MSHPLAGCFLVPNATSKRNRAAKSGVLRSGREPSINIAVPSAGPRDPADSPATLPEPLKARNDEAKDYAPNVEEEDLVAMTVSASPRKPTFLQKERWKAIQEAERRGLSIRGMVRELGIHRDTVKRYIDADNPPTRRFPVTPTDTPSDNIANQARDISAEQLEGHLS